MRSPSPSVVPTTCISLLSELQIIWDEIGESVPARDAMLLQLEHECLDIYRRKVMDAKNYLASLHKKLADSRSEIGDIAAALGDGIPSLSTAHSGLQQQLEVAKAVLEQMTSEKVERMNQFLEVQSQIDRISGEITGKESSTAPAVPQVNDRDLTLKRLGDLKLQLHELQNEKSVRIQRVKSHIKTIHQLSIVMSLDFLETVGEVHPSLAAQAGDEVKSISNDTLARLTNAINSLTDEKGKRLEKLQNLGRNLIELWNLMDMPFEDQKLFPHVTSLMSSSVDKVTMQGSLALDVIEQTEVEVERLNILKASKMKELVFKRQNELEEIYREVHMDVDSNAARQILLGLMESENVYMTDLLASMDDQVVKAKEQARSRKEILDKVEKWKHAADEEKWLDEYEKDVNRYSAGKGAHKSLNRAEKARILVNKLPSMVEGLTAKVLAWESEKGIPFLYHKAPLLQTLEEYTVFLQERDEEKRRAREQRRLQEQKSMEQEVKYGSRPLVKKPLGQSNTLSTPMGTPNARRISTPGRPVPGLSSARASASASNKQRSRADHAPLFNYVALSKEDASSRGN
ncbi:hypothetical protein MLD38_018825 [Melastoma candidum]|uniref:Uncharacterized protein n=1 Tax=Melastoma candidum TaxID=119954 RepID=A0ACB9QZ13_9MYRT|nr:hypothetical protein MLD38_018825 [Melastoma candidum]